MSVVVANRYRLVRELGRGGSGRVLLALDAWRADAEVALKLLGVDAGAGAWHGDVLAREFAWLARVRHPHVAQALGFGRLGAAFSCDALGSAAAGSAFLVQELCVGQPLHTWAVGRSPALILEAAAQIAAALATLHAVGVRHGDVKPHNIVMGAAGGPDAGDAPCAKLIDFGLAGRGIGTEVAGTPSYMAKEALAGAASPASDVFGLGAALAHALSGAPPVPASRRALSSPRHADLVAALTDPDESRRVDAAAAFELLLAAVPEPGQARLAALRDVGAVGAGLFGRDEALAAIDSALLGDAPGARVLCLNGPPGSGRTALAEETVARAVGLGLGVLGGVIAAASGDVAGLERALDGLDAAAALASGTADLAPLDGAAGRWRHLALLAERLAQASRAHRLVVVFDAVPANSVLADLGGFIARQAERGPNVTWVQTGALVGSAAPGRPPVESETARQLAVAPARPPIALESARHSPYATAPGLPSAAFVALTLLPLEVAAMRSLVRAARPLRAGDVQAAEALCGASGGVPGHAVALLQQHPGAALLEAALVGRLGRGSDTAGLEPALARLGGSARDLARLLALCRAPLPLALVRGTLGDAAVRAADELAAEGLATWRAVGGEPALALGGEAVRDALADTAELPLVQRLVDALVSVGLERAWAADCGRLWHRLGKHDRARPLLLAAARAAALAFRFRDALDCYRLFLDSPGLSAAERRLALVESGRVCVTCGDPEEALARFVAAAPLPDAVLARAEALVALGRFAEAVEALEGEPTLSGDTLAAAEALLARATLLGGDYVATRAVVARARARLAVHPRAAELANATGMVAFYDGQLGPARRELEEAMRAARERGDLMLADACQANLALVLHKALDVAGAEAAYSESLAYARAVHDLPREIVRLGNLATLQQERGKTAAALDSYRQAYELAHLIDSGRERVRIALNWSNRLIWLGASARGRELAERAVAEARHLGMTFEAAYLVLVGVEAALVEGDLARARALLADAQTALDASPSAVLAAEIDAARAEVQLFARDFGRAYTTALAAASAAEAAGRPRIAAQALVWATLAACEDGVAAGASSTQSGQGAQGAQSAPSRPSALSTAERLASLADRLEDPDYGWLAHAALARLGARQGRGVDAELHAARGRQLALQAASRLSPEYERSYVDVWYRRELWLSLAQARAAAPSAGARNLDGLLAINRELAQDHDPERLLERIIDAAIALSGAERGFVILQDEAAALVIRAARNMEEAALAGANLEFSRSIAREVIGSGLPLCTLDAQGDERFREQVSVHHLHLRSVVCLPLRTRHGSLGALYLDHRQRVDAFSDADVALLTAFSDQAAVALANAQRLAELAARTFELERSRAAIDELNARLAKELEARSAELELLRPPGALDHEAAWQHGMVGKSAAMRAIFRVIERVADKDVPVTILGESGTGKELVARALHAGGPRGKQPFVSVNCGAIPRELLESELFGHERGSFTGAVRSKAGLFEVARGGTLLLDEIGELPLDMQVKLLRVLQQKEFRRVGGTALLEADVRVLAASNRDLSAMAQAGSFREDLWYRLNVVEIKVPPLRDRRDDLPPLIEHLLARHAGARPPPKLSRAALAALLDYGWPGNVRELENELQRAIALSDGSVAAADLSPKLHEAPPARRELASPGTLRDRLEGFERAALADALAKHDGVVSAAARALGLTRAGLYKKLHKYALFAHKG